MHGPADRIRDLQGTEGTLVASSPDGVTGKVTVHLHRGEDIVIPRNLISPGGDGVFQLRGVFTDWARPSKQRTHHRETRDEADDPTSAK